MDAATDGRSALARPTGIAVSIPFTLRRFWVAFGFAALLALAPLRAQEAGVDPVVVDGPTEQIIAGALRFLASQQQASGAWTDGDAAQCKLQNPIFGVRIFDVWRGDLLALVLKDVKPALANYEVHTADGSVDSVEARVGNLTVRGEYFGTQLLKVDDVTELCAGPARWHALTDLPPVPLNVPRRIAIDKTLSGSALTDSAGAPVRGIEMAVGTTCLWKLPAGFAALIAQVRVPADVAPTQKLVFTVYDDTRPILRSPVLSSADSPVTLRGPLAAARSLSLRVESVSPAAAIDRGLWIEPTRLRQ